MPRLHETAYPRLKAAVTESELQEIYSPTAEELVFAGYSPAAPKRVGIPKGARM
jgi:hypothetical protein